MNTFKIHGRMTFRLVILVAIVFMMSVTVYAENGGAQNKLLVKIQTDSKEQVQWLANMGLDIWDIEGDFMTVAVSEAEIETISGMGFSMQVLAYDVYDLIKSITTQESPSKFDLSLESIQATTSTQSVTFDEYHSYDEMRVALSNLENSGVAKVYKLGTSIEGRDILAIKISDNPNVDEGEPQVLFLGNHHAREWISLEVPLYLAYYLVINYDKQEMKKIINATEIWIVPLVNPDGYEYSRTVDRLWRKNRRDNGFWIYGVDLNRNYDYEWGGEGASHLPWSEVYCGPYAFSEPETQAIRNLVQSSRFEALVTYHSYQQLILYPWGYTDEPAPDECLMSSTAKRMADLIEEVHGKHYTPQQSSDLYKTTGDTTDWSYGVHNIPSFTIELRPDSAVPGFLLPASEIIPTCEENLNAALFMIEWAINPAQRIIDRGLCWLRNRQDFDGSWYYGDPAVTSFAVLTMLNWGYDESDPVVSQGINYVLSTINPDGSVYYDPWHYTYYTAIAILPLAAAHNVDYHDEIEGMRNWLIDSQWDESCLYGSVETDDWYYGGFGYGSGTRPDLSNTQWALMGLKAADKELGLDAGSTYDKCANYFLARCRQSDGGSTYTPEYEDWSIHSMTAASVWSYALCGRGSGPEALGGIQWLTNHYSLTNNDGWGWWSEYYYNVTLAKALTMTHSTMLGPHDWFAELSQKLINEQYSGGNWPDTGMMGSEMSTCWAIMALQTRILPPSGEFGMWATLESHAVLHIYDPQGRHLGINYETNTIEENIPGATFKIVDSNGNEVPYDGNTPGEGLTQVINLPMVVAGSYRIELVGTSDGPYHLIIGGTQDGNTVTSQTYDGEILTGQRLATNVTVTSMEGALTLIFEPLSVLPTLGVEPSELTVVVEPDTIGQATFTVKEVGGQETLHGVSMYCIDIAGQSGHIDGSSITFDPIGFDIVPGGSQIVSASIPVPADFRGPGTGSIVVESIDGGTKAIELTLLTDVTPPEVEIIIPEPDVAVQDGVALTAEANDVSGVAALWFYVREPNDGNGVPIGQEDLAATFNPATGKWEYAFDTTQLPDGYYVVLAKAVDTYGNVGWSEVVPFSIRNWAIITMLPATPNSKAGRTMPVKFSIRIAKSVDPAMPFVYNEDLEIRIYKSTNPSVILQRSLFGLGATDYRINSIVEQYITNFKTLTTPATYVVEIWRPAKNFKVGSFTFKTVK